MGYQIFLFVSHSFGSRNVKATLFTTVATRGEESYYLKLIYGGVGVGSRSPENNPSIITFLRNLLQLMHFMGSAADYVLYTIFSRKAKEVTTDL
jgi:hypothetical protein